MFDPFHDIVCISYLTRRNSLASPSHVCRVTVAKVRLFYRIWQHSVRSRASTRSNIDIDSLIYWSRFRRGRRVNTVACFVRAHMPWVFVMPQRATLETRSKLFTPALDHTLEVRVRCRPQRRRREIFTCRNTWTDWMPEIFYIQATEFCVYTLHFLEFA